MRRLLTLIILVAAAPSFGQGRKAAQDAELKKETSAAPDKSLAGDLTRKKDTTSKAAPALQYDQFRLGVELQVADKRRQQIQDLQKIIELSDKDPKEMPKLLFRLGELYWEESKYFFFEANRKDDDLIRAMNAGDQQGQERAKAAKAELLAESKGYAKQATDLYSEIIQRYKKFDRTDEVLYFLGHNLMELGDDRKGLVAFKRLIEKYPKSKFLPDAHLAFGEYYFNNSKGKREMLEKALESYKKAAEFPENQVYGFALYKQGWCYFNLADYQRAMDMYKAVVLYGEIAGVKEVEGAGKKGGRAGLIKEARADFVRSYARSGGSPSDARPEFAKLAKANEDRYTMMKQLANLYYEDGKDREAALAYNMLIREKPLSPEAPGFQGKIVDCVLRAGNKKMTVDQVRRLVKVMDDVKKANVIRDEKDKKALEEARELSERTISNLAVNWHNEAKKTRDDETFGFANEVYADYLTLFPDNKKAHDLRFFWAELLNDNLHRYDKAAEEYTKVFLEDVRRTEQAAKGEKDAEGNPIKPGKYMVNAAYNAVHAYDKVVEQLTNSGKLKAPVISDIKKKVDIAPQRQSLLEACERYVKHLPQGEKRVEIAFKAGKIYYDHNYLDEAVARFSDIALNHSDHKFENGDRAGEIAANLVLDSYNLLGDWAKVLEWGEKFYANEKLAVGAFKDELRNLLEKTRFKLAQELEGKGDYGKAADAYMAFVRDAPKSDIADQALFNEAICRFKAKQLDKAIDARQRLIRNYGKSKYVPQTMFALAEGYEAIADFDKAADYYESYAAGFIRSQKGGAAPAPRTKRGKKSSKARAAPSTSQGWEEAKAQIALINAGVFRDGLGEYKKALENRRKYLELWPEAKDAEAVLLSIVDLHEKNGKYSEALRQLEEYEREFMRDANKVLTAEGRIASVYDDKLRSSKNARRIYERILSYYDKLPARTKRGLEISALDAVARAHFVLAEDDYRKYAGIRLRWSKLTNIGEYKGSVQEKAKSLESIQKLYTTTVGFKSADPAICALNKIGLAYDHFVKALLNSPIPKGMPEDLLFEFKGQLEQQVLPIKDKAAEAFAATVQKSQEFDIFNECTVTALNQLRDHYRPEQFPKMPEEVPELKGDFANQVMGSGLLAEIQPIPATSEGQVAGISEQARNVAAQDPDTLSAPDRDEGSAPAPRRASPRSTSVSEEPSDEPL